MIRFDYVYEELPINGELISITAEVAVDPYDPSEWHFEAATLTSYDEIKDAYTTLVVKGADPVLRALVQMFETNYRMRFDLEDEINEVFDNQLRPVWGAVH